LIETRARWWIYPVALALLWASWIACMFARSAWPLYATRWPMALTMVLGSFIAGSTPIGGGAIAYPVFTKLLAIPSREAALFGLMIQSVGMSMAALFIVSRGLRFDRRVLGAALLGAIPGVVLGLAFVRLPAHVPRLGFTCLLLIFGVVWATVRYRRPEPSPVSELAWRPSDTLRVSLTGLLGGVIASSIGSGPEMLCFMVMTLGYRLEPRVAVPTAVMIMAATSVVGFAVRLLQPQPIGVVWEYWAVAVPIVVVGAPLGAWVASKVPASVISTLVLTLIGAEVLSTALLVPLALVDLAWIGAVGVLALLWFHRLGRLPRQASTA
jgi:uncharacterized membrane protein YfcA